MPGKEFPIAVIGIATRLPGAQSCNDLWKLLATDKNGAKKLLPRRSSNVPHIISAFRDHLVDEKDPFLTGSYLESVDEFDCAFFSIDEREAIHIEPEQRIFLEAVWNLFEDSGYSCKIKGTHIGVYVGSTTSKYECILTKCVSTQYSLVLSFRVSHMFDLHGPAITLPVGCSSLSAVHLACEGLLSGECEMAIVGEVSVDLLPLNLKQNVWENVGGGIKISCSEGCGVVLLKPLHNPIADMDFVYAVLKTTSSNRHGTLLDPDCLCHTWKLAHIFPDHIACFEFHSGKASVEDPVMVCSITNALKNLKNGQKFSLQSIGAITGQLACSGGGIFAGIKAILCLMKRNMLLVTNAPKQSSNNDLKEACTSVIEKATSSRSASCSTFDASGSSVHVVLKEYLYSQNIESVDNNVVPISEHHNSQLLVMAANSPNSLLRFISDLFAFFKSSEDRSYRHLQNVCYSLNSGRKHDNLCYRAVIFAENWDQMHHNLKFLLDNELIIDLSQTSAAFEKKWRYNEGCGAFHSPSSLSVNVSSIAGGFYDAILTYVKGISISWSHSYGNNNELRKIPFDKIIRLWPKPVYPVCLIPSQQQPQNLCENFKHVPTIKPPAAYSSLLAEALNNMLGENYDWCTNGDKSLLSLTGIDGGKLTHICETLQGTSCDLVQLPDDPTFNGDKLAHICGTLQGTSCDVQLPDDPTFNTLTAHLVNTTQRSAEIPCNQQEEGPTADSIICLRVVLNEHPLSKNLSNAQQSKLLIQGACPQSTAFVHTVAYYTQDSSTFTGVFEYLVQRHPILACVIHKHSCIQNYEIGIDQHVVKFDIKVESIECLEEASQYLRETIPVIKIFASPIAVFRLLKVSNNDVTVVAVHVHHIISDEFTLSSIGRDIHEFLNGIGQANIVLDNYMSASEEAYFNSSQCSVDSQFWSDKFALLPPDVNLTMLSKADSIWNNSMLYQAKQITNSIPKNITAVCCRDLQITKFDYHLACTCLVVQRYLGVPEIAIAIPVNTRSAVGNNNVDGAFVNPVLFTTSININVSLIEYVQKVSKDWSLIVNHSQYPLDRVAKMIQQKHGKNYNSFCCVAFNYFSQRMSSSNKVPVHAKHAKIPFGINIISNQDNTTTISCEWAADIIDDGIAERIFDGILKLCQKAPAMLDQIISNIQVLSSIELDLIYSFSHTKSSVNSNGLSLVHIFEDNVNKDPSACAVACQNRTLTYEQLNTLATRIAFGLIQQVGRVTLHNKPVLLLSDKDEYAIVSILGIWKAGGHYLPVSITTYKSVVESTSVAAVIVNLPTDDMCDLYFKAKVFNVTDLLLNTASDVREEKTTEDQLAYIIRTSGTTGKAKQCKVSHKNLSIIANAWKIKYDMTTFHVNVLQWAPITFDVFIGDLVKALICSNGVLTICPNQYRLDIPYIIGAIKQQQVTLAEVTPQFGSQLVQNAKHGDLDSLKLFILGSDVLSSHVYMKVKRHLNKNQRVLNSYGMTEATIDSSFFEGSILPKTRSNTVPIGKPLPGVHLYVIDMQTLQPCPVGTIGELYIGGSALASGDVRKCYIKGIDHECLKTGDAACWLPSGDLELLGRLDNVVKLRGFRMSTTEIESKIITHVKGIQDVCVTVLASDEPRNVTKFLCAFVVLEPHFSVDYITVKSMLCGNIPDYMLPDVVHPIEMLPMSENGKVNYKALPKLSDIWNRKIISETSLREQTPAHVTLTYLLAEAMDILPNQVNTEQTFMEQGCNSLILLRFVSLIKDRSSYDIEIATVFSYPSISSLAIYINEIEEHGNCK